MSTSHAHSFCFMPGWIALRRRVPAIVFKTSEALRRRAALFALTVLVSTAIIDFVHSDAHADLKYDFAGRMGAGSDDYGKMIAVDSAGNIYTTGEFRDTVDFDPDPGNTVNLTSAGGIDAFVQKLDSSGNFVWAKSIGGASSVIGAGIAVDSAGNVYTTGYFQGTADFDPGASTSNLTSAGLRDIFVQKLDTSGNFVWAKRMGGGSNDYGQGIAVDDAGNVYTIGWFIGTVDFDPAAGTTNLTSAGSEDVFVQKLDTTGTFVWAKAMGGSSNDGGYGIAVDAAGNVYTTGLFRVTADFDPDPGTTANLISAGNADIFVLKLDAAGSFVWAEAMGASSGDDYGEGIAVDAAGNVYTTGFFVGTADFDPDTGTTDNLTSAGSNDIFVQKLDAAGTFAWAKAMGDTSNDFGLAIAVDALGDVYTTGQFGGTVDFDPDSGNTVDVTSAGNSDIYVHKLDSSGNFVWVKTMGGSGSNGGAGIAVDAAGSVYTTGNFLSTADFDPDPGNAVNLTSAGLSDIFVSKFVTDPIYVDIDNAGAEDGLSWATAYNTIQEGIDAASYGDEIWVAEGTYSEVRSSVNADGAGVDTGSVVMKAGVSLYGGFDATETSRLERDWDTNATIIDGSTSRSGSAAIHVVVGSDNATLDGFTVTGGDATAGATSATQEGGGMFNNFASPTVANCIFTANNAEQGGAMKNSDSSPTVHDCVFAYNTAVSAAGGMKNKTNSSPAITDCVFVANSGNAVLNEVGSSPTITRCIFTLNWEQFQGGAMINENTSAPLIVDSVFVNNEAKTQKGGAISSHTSSAPVITNSLFIGNKAGAQGGALYNENSTSTAINSTFSANTSSGGVVINETSTPIFLNTIMYGNPQSGISGTAATVSYSNFEGGYSGTGNIDSDPLFIGGPSGTTTDLTYSSSTFKSTITDNAAEWEANVFVGAVVEIGSGDHYYIIANSATTLTVWGDATGGGTTATYDITDYRLFGSSPSVDTGTATGAPTTDLLGNARPVDFPSVGIEGAGAIDMGAYEMTPTLVFVDIDNVSTEDGYTWTTAYNTIQEGIDAAVALGLTEVWVADGTYTGNAGAAGGENNVIIMNAGVHIYGGFAGTESQRSQRDWDANVTIIDGETTANKRVVYAANNSTLDGFTITRGNATVNANGGGMHVPASTTLTIANCIFLNNVAGVHGGGLHNLSSSSPTVTNCQFIGNSTGSTGGAISNFDGSQPIITNSYFSGNSSARGAAIYNTGSGTAPTITNCVFVSNTASNDGGAIVGDSSSSGTVTGSTFSQNSATGGHGGAIHLGSSSTLDTYRSVFLDNTSSIKGGGMDIGSGVLTTVENSIFVGNNSGSDGGGLSNDAGSTLTLSNSVFLNNDAGVGSGGGGGVFSNSGITVKNTVLRDNAAPNTGDDMWSNGSGSISFSNYVDVVGLTPTSSSTTAPDFRATTVITPTGVADDPSFESGISRIVTDSGATWKTNQFTDGILVVDSNYYHIASNTNTTLTVWGNASASGSSYSIMDLHPETTSPLVDQGTGSGTPTIDIAGNSRGFDFVGVGSFTYDIGVFELQDADNDGLSDIEELVLGTNPNSNDTDGDGMDDLWEVDNSTDPTVDDAAADTDGDGHSNFDEFTNGTDPNVAQAPPFDFALRYGSTLDIDAIEDIEVDAAGNVYVTGTFRGTVDFDVDILTSESDSTDSFIIKRNAAGVNLWVKQLTGTDSVSVREMAVDGWGNIIVFIQFSGTADVDPDIIAQNFLVSNGGNDLGIVKLDSNGDFLWAESWGTTINENVGGIAVDASGNIFLAGSFLGDVTFPGGNAKSNVGSSWTGYVLKLDTSGAFAWVGLFEGATGRVIFVQGCLALDSDGNVYVAGDFHNSDIDFDPGSGTANRTLDDETDAFIVKLNPDGTFGWVTSSSGTGQEYGAEIVVDANGNIYLAGGYQSTATFGAYTITSQGGLDVFVTMMDSTGAFQWASSFGGTLSDAPVGIDIDSDGNIFIVGQLEGTAVLDPNTAAGVTSAGSYDVFVAKLDSSGDWVWAQEFGESDTDAGYAIAVDLADNIYVGGEFSGASVDFDPGVGTTALTSAGLRDIFFMRLGVQVDTDGDGIIDTKEAALGTNPALVDSDGDLMDDKWELDNGFDPTTDDGAASADADGDGFTNLEEFQNGTDPNVVEAPLFDFALRYGGIDDVDAVNDIAVDDVGNSYLVGTFKATADFEGGDLTATGLTDSFVIKRDPIGNQLWIKQFGGPDNGVDTTDAKHVAVDGSGNVIIYFAYSGTVDFNPSAAVTYDLTSTGGNETAVVKLDSNGDFLWAHTWGTGANEGFGGLAIDGSDNIFMSGNFIGSQTFPGSNGVSSMGAGISTYVLKLNSSGGFVWAKVLGSPTSGQVLSQQGTVAVDTSGNVYITGSHSSSAVDFDPHAVNTANPAAAGAFVLKLLADGTFGWVTTATGAGSTYGYEIAVDSSTNIYVSGGFTLDSTWGGTTLNSLGGQDTFVTRLNSSGTVIWASAMNSTLEVAPFGIDYDSAGNVYVSGQFMGVASFDDALDTLDPISSMGARDAFVAKLTSLGNWEWVQEYGGNWTDSGRAVAVDLLDNIFLGGEFAGTNIDFDHSTNSALLTSNSSTLASNRDMFLMRIGLNDDGDGMPLWWEILHGLNPQLDDSASDADG
ncbi:SBBP repeat-containing protein, partial [bacterium AH-315-P07]|nr:SBBP repeat-containing protein [bacterium AH-315-P07]